MNNTFWLKNWGLPYQSKTKVNKLLNALYRENPNEIKDVPAFAYQKLSLPILKHAFLSELSTILEPFGIQRPLIEKTFATLEGVKRQTLFNKTRKWLNLAYDKDKETEYRGLFQEAKRHPPSSEEIASIRNRLQPLIMGKYERWLDLWERKAK